jgi:hypothetical protein
MGEGATVAFLILIILNFSSSRSFCSYDVAIEDLPRVATIVKSGMEGALPFLKVLG